ncbi:MurNAc alpha-1-phosphate uridylyltransferase [Amorphus suaedae]
MTTPSTRPTRAMVLAAGFGKRMRPVTATTPKPLVEVAGRSLIDYGLDRLQNAGVEEAVVNVHYLADLMEVHLSRRKAPRVTISDERGKLLDTGGGIAKALPHFRDEPFFLLNADTFWLEGATPNLVRLANAWNPAEMDGLLMLAPTVTSIGYDGTGDFVLSTDGRIARRSERHVAPFAYAGAGIISPGLFQDVPEGGFSLNLLFDRAIADGRMFGLRMDGLWLHVGTPKAIRDAEAAIAESAA